VAEADRKTEIRLTPRAVFASTIPDVSENVQLPEKGFGFEKPEDTLGRKVVKWLPLFAVGVFLAGGIAFTIAYFGNTSHVKHPGVRPGKPVDASKTPPTVPVPKTARHVAGEYIITAMTRQNLAKSWALTHPSLKKGYTKKEWLTGTIPVQYFPAKAIAGASFKVQWSHPNDVLLNVYVFAKPKSGVKSQSFFIELKPVGTGVHKRWLVSYVAPSSGAVTVPNVGAGAG
jgi:hypothetical protein